MEGGVGFVVGEETGERAEIVGKVRAVGICGEGKGEAKEEKGICASRETCGVHGGEGGDLLGREAVCVEPVSLGCITVAMLVEVREQ